MRKDIVNKVKRYIINKINIVYNKSYILLLYKEILQGIGGKWGERNKQVI